MVDALQSPARYTEQGRTDHGKEGLIERGLRSHPIPSVARITAKCGLDFAISKTVAGVTSLHPVTSSTVSVPTLRATRFRSCSSVMRPEPPFALLRFSVVCGSSGRI